MKYLLVLVALAASLGWIVIASNIEDRSPVSSEESLSDSSDLPALSASSDPTELVNEKQAKRQVAREFVTVFYSRNQGMYEGSVDERTARYQAQLRAVVSEEFLSDYVRPLTLAQDVQLISNGGSVSARIFSFDGGHDEEILLTILREVRTPHKPSYHYKTSLMLTLTKVNSAWLVDTLTEMS